MIGRRIAAAFPVLLAHAIVLYLLAFFPASRPRTVATLETGPITLYLNPQPESRPPVRGAVAREAQPRTPAVPAPTAITLPAAPAAPGVPGRVDWPLEGRKSAARVLAQEAESERIARMFAGPDGTWASLTKRERSRLKRFRWKPGIDGLEYDSDGNALYHISEGCVIVNSGFIGCTIGKAKVHGDLFKDMRLYFDERRLPQTEDGNGTEDP